MSTGYTYSVYGSHPFRTSPSPWHTHTRVPCDGVESAEDALLALADDCIGLPDYPSGSEIYVLVLDAEDQVVQLISTRIRQ